MKTRLNTKGTGKRIAVILLTVIMTMSVLTGCGSKNEASNSTPATSQSSSG